MADGRKNNGAKKGENRGQGRKPKAEELKIINLGTNAIIEVYGSVEKYWNHIANESKKSLPHLKMLTEYIYGKPKERIDLTTDDESLNNSLDYSKLSMSALKEIAELNEDKPEQS